MQFGGKFHFISKRMQVLVMATLAIFLFQNCGTDPQNQEGGLYMSSGYNNYECLSETVDCGANPDYLQITLDMKDGQVVPSASSEWSVTGRCNTGNYENYYIYWEIIDSNASVVRSGTEMGICSKGKFNFPVDVQSLTTNVLMNLKVTIIGKGSDGLDYENFGDAGSAQLDFSVQ